MLLRALENGGIWEGIEEDIVLAMIGTIGDVMPLTGENRILVVHGLKFASKLPPGPLKDLIDAVSNGKPLTSGDIAFRVVPRINAAGRMKHPSLALEALLSGGKALDDLHRLNGDRQSAIEDAIDAVRPLIDWTSPFLCAASADVSPGIVGLIAGRLTEESGRPTLIAAIKGDVCTGSLRSIEKIDVMSCLQHPTVRPLLLTCGGHAQAAGCTFLLKNLPGLKLALAYVLRDLGFAPETLLPEITIDHELPHAHLTLPLARKLQSLEPFGQGNEEPLFLIRNLTIESVRTVGGDGTHLQIAFGAHRGIAFRCGGLADQLAPGRIVDIACCLGVNSWNGRDSLQLMVKDIRGSG